jgi:hypothetical protein
MHNQDIPELIPGHGDEQNTDFETVSEMFVPAMINRHRGTMRERWQKHIHAHIPEVLHNPDAIRSIIISDRGDR